MCWLSWNHGASDSCKPQAFSRAVWDCCTYTAYFIPYSLTRLKHDGGEKWIHAGDITIMNSTSGNSWSFLGEIWSFLKPRNVFVVIKFPEWSRARLLRGRKRFKKGRKDVEGFERKQSSVTPQIQWNRSWRADSCLFRRGQTTNQASYAPISMRLLEAAPKVGLKSGPTVGSFMITTLQVKEWVFTFNKFMAKTSPCLLNLAASDLRLLPESKSTLQRRFSRYRIL
jgi:hypothetical protein